MGTSGADNSGSLGAKYYKVWIRTAGELIVDLKAATLNTLLDTETDYLQYIQSDAEFTTALADKISLFNGKDINSTKTFKISFSNTGQTVEFMNALEATYNMQDCDIFLAVLPIKRKTLEAGDTFIKIYNQNLAVYIPELAGGSDLMTKFEGSNTISVNDRSFEIDKVLADI